MSKVERLKRAAREKADEKSWSAAIELYGRAVAAAEKDGLSASEVGLYNRIGDLYLKLDDASQAVYHYLLAVDEYAEAEMYPPAVALCHKVLRVAPDQVEAYRKLARLHVDTGLMADARREFDRYLSGVWETGEVEGALAGLDDLAAVLMNGAFDAEEFRRLQEQEEHQEAFELLCDCWSSADHDQNGAAPPEPEEDGEATPEAAGDGDGPSAARERPEGHADEAAAGEVDGSDADPAGTADGAAEAEESTPEPAAAAEIEATGAARELALEHGIDLAAIEGTGQAGRIVKADVEAALVRGMDVGHEAPARPEGEDADRAVPTAPVSVEPDALSRRGPEVAAVAAGMALRRYEPPAVVATMAAPAEAPLLKSPSVTARAAWAALRGHEPPAVVAPMAAPGEAPLRRAPRVAASAAWAALRAYEPPAVLAPVAALAEAPLRRAPRVAASAAWAALDRYEAPVAVAPIAVAADFERRLEPRIPAGAVERPAAGDLVALADATAWLVGLAPTLPRRHEAGAAADAADGEREPGAAVTATVVLRPSVLRIRPVIDRDAIPGLPALTAGDEQVSARDDGNAPVGEAPEEDAPASQDSEADEQESSAPSLSVEDGRAVAGDESDGPGEDDREEEADAAAGGGETAETADVAPIHATTDGSPPDFTGLLAEVGWLSEGSSSGNGAGHRNGNGAGPNGNGEHAGDGMGRVRAGESGDVPEDPRLRRTLAPWAPRGEAADGDEREQGDTETLDFTELLHKVGWLQEEERAQAS